MKNLGFIAIVILVVIVVNSCVKFATQVRKEEKIKNGSRITSSLAKELIEKDSGKAIILDVRTPQEYNGGHIKNAINISLQTISDKADKRLKDKDQRIYVYCRSGNRSTSASKILVNKGYTNIVNIGGISSWKGETE